MRTKTRERRSSGFLGLLADVFASFGDPIVQTRTTGTKRPVRLVQREVRSEGNLVIYLGFGEQNGVLVKVLLAFFGSFAAELIGLPVLLRFEPNFRSAPFSSEL